MLSMHVHSLLLTNHCCYSDFVELQQVNEDTQGVVASVARGGAVELRRLLP